MHIRKSISASSRGEQIDNINGVPIYDDGEIYIYTDKNGKGRMEFPTPDEAREYIEENNITASLKLTPYKDRLIELLRDGTIGAEDLAVDLFEYVTDEQCKEILSNYYLEDTVESATQLPDNLGSISLQDLAVDLGYSEEEIADWFELDKKEIGTIFYDLTDQNDNLIAKTIWDTYYVAYSGHGVEEANSLSEAVRLSGIGDVDID